MQNGGGVRARAALFLNFHCHTGATDDSDEIAADAINEILADRQPRFAIKVGISNFEPAMPHQVQNWRSRT